MMECETVNEKTKPALIAFLRKHNEYTLFLLSNLENFGWQLSDHPYSGAYKVVRKEDQIIAAFSLTKKGTLLIHGEESSSDLFDLILEACKEEKIPLTGVIGEWEFCSSFWEFLKKKQLIQKETFVEKEFLYALKLGDYGFNTDPDVRYLTSDDFESWLPLREAYIKEMRFPINSFEEMQGEFLRKTIQKMIWGLFLNGALVATADLNASFQDLGQLGGVYTLPERRKQGLATLLVRHIICDLQPRFSTLIIFTGLNNLPARKVYESLPSTPSGHFALLFGSL